MAAGDRGGQARRMTCGERGPMRCWDLVILHRNTISSSNCNIQSFRKSQIKLIQDHGSVFDDGGDSGGASRTSSNGSSSWRMGTSVGELIFFPITISM